MMKSAAVLLLLAGTAVAADPLLPVAVADVTIEGGFWGPRIDANARVTLPHNLEFIEKTGRMAPFDRAAGIKTSSTDNDVSVVDSDVHKILEGAAYTRQLRPDAVDIDEVARQVGRVIAAQQDDGFLCPRLNDAAPEERWRDLRHSHLLYSAGHLFEAGVAWRDATAKNDLLDASIRFADLIDRTFGPGKLHHTAGHQEIEMALVKLYHATGERRYLDLCRFLLDERGHIHGGRERVSGLKPRADDYNQDRVPLAEAEHAVGHAVRAGYTYAAMADIAMICPDHGYDHALDRLWDDVVGRKLYLTGASATAQYYDEGFGDPYVLPNDTAYAETCGSTASALWFWRMALLRGDAKYADLLERALYNGVLSGISLSGDKFFYKNPLASRGGVSRHPSWNPACCQSNLVRIIPQVGSMAYASGDDAIHVNLFVAGTAKFVLSSGEALLRMETEYPHDGRIRITVESAPEKPFTLALRIPGWSREEVVPGDLYRFAKPSTERPSLTVVGGAVSLDSLEKGYARITRTWRKGDSIVLDLPMPVRRVLAHERVEADRGRVALQLGPLVYCVESIDHAGLPTDALVLPDDTALELERRTGLPGGVAGITADAAIAFEPAWGEAPRQRAQKLTAVPYYSWANRGDGFMDVWLARTVEMATPLAAETASTVAKVSDSTGRPPKQLSTINDRRWGPTSDFRDTPRVSLAGSGDGRAWLQFEWSEPRKLSRSSVYWAVDRRAQVYWGKRIRGVDLALPESWRILYRDGENWKPVEAVAPDGDPWAIDKMPSPFTLRLDFFNDVRFKPVETTALRLEVELGTTPCAVQEWVLD